MLITKYHPAFCTGFEEESYSVSSKEEILKVFKCEHRQLICCSGKHLMEVVIEGGKIKWWIIAYVHNDQDANLLSKWFPRYEPVSEFLQTAINYCYDERNKMFYSTLSFKTEEHQKLIEFAKELGLTRM